MEGILIYIKHHLGFLWKLIEWSNGIFFSLFYKSKLEKILPDVFQEISEPPFSYRKLTISDTEELYDLIMKQNASDLEYFKPHRFDFISIKKQFNINSFLMMGTFDGKKMIGYFFIRFFASRKCFVGRLIDKEYRGKGIGIVMNKIMYTAAWRLDFRCLSTISCKNKAVMNAHAKNPSMVVLKELKNDYLLVEFLKEGHLSGHRGEYNFGRNMEQT